jgi:hypothetical protein
MAVGNMVSSGLRLDRTHLATLGLAIWLIYPLQILRQTVRNPGPLKQRIILAWFQMLSRFPQALGQIKFLLDRLAGRRSLLIEYK